MPVTLNAHKLFTRQDGYLLKLRVPDSDDAALRKAREEIRATLRAAFRGFAVLVKPAELFQDHALQKSLGGDTLPAPKFRIQGSFAYDTVNDCQQTPPQQIDQDDGVYMPLGFLTKGGKVRPNIVAAAYFDLVEKALAPLCATRRWRLNPGETKDTCVRVEISARLHIDIPLYAIKDSEFQRLADASTALRKAASQLSDDDLSDDVYRGLDKADILLAHRKEGWIPSDPRRMENWFLGAVGLYGDQVRRLSRVYKGMRDNRWKYDDLRSICIMAALVKAFEIIGVQDDRRDDLAIAKTARQMAKLFAHPIENPVIDGGPKTYLCEGWTAEFRREVCDFFERTADVMDQVTQYDNDREVALKRIRNHFGARIPNDKELILGIGAPAYIRQTEAETQPKPATLRGKSG